MRVRKLRTGKPKPPIAATGFHDRRSEGCRSGSCRAPSHLSSGVHRSANSVKFLQTPQSGSVAPVPTRAVPGSRPNRISVIDWDLLCKNSTQASRVAAVPSPTGGLDELHGITSMRSRPWGQCLETRHPVSNSNNGNEYLNRSGESRQGTRGHDVKDKQLRAEGEKLLTNQLKLPATHTPLADRPHFPGVVSLAALCLCTRIHLVSSLPPLAPPVVLLSVGESLSESLMLLSRCLRPLSSSNNASRLPGHLAGLYRSHIGPANPARRPPCVLPPAIPHRRLILTHIPRRIYQRRRREDRQRSARMVRR